jgi:hypothetical protein
MLNANVRNWLVETFNSPAVLEAHFNTLMARGERLLPFGLDQIRSSYEFDAASTLSWLKAAADCEIPYVSISQPIEIHQASNKRALDEIGQRLHEMMKGTHSYVRFDGCIPNSVLDALSKNREEKFAGLSRHPIKLTKTRLRLDSKILTHQMQVMTQEFYVFLQGYDSRQTFDVIDVIDDKPTKPNAMVSTFIEKMKELEIKPSHPMMHELQTFGKYRIVIRSLNGVDEVVGGLLFYEVEDELKAIRRFESLYEAA